MILVGIEELASGHYEGCKKEGAPPTDIIESMQDGVEKVDEGIEAQKDVIPQVKSMLLRDKTGINGIDEGIGRRREYGSNRARR